MPTWTCWNRREGALDFVCVSAIVGLIGIRVADALQSVQTSQVAIPAMRVRERRWLPRQGISHGR